MLSFSRQKGKTASGIHRQLHRPLKNPLQHNTKQLISVTSELLHDARCIVQIRKKKTEKEKRNP